MPHYCDDRDCQYCEELTCTAGNVYHVNRYCVTRRRRPHKENYRELMKTPAGICHRDKGKMKSKGGNVLK